MERIDEKLAAARPRKFTLEELDRFNAECDARHEPGLRELDWSEIKRIIAESKLAGLGGDGA